MERVIQHETRYALDRDIKDVVIDGASSARVTIDLVVSPEDEFPFAEVKSMNPEGEVRHTIRCRLPVVDSHNMFVVNTESNTVEAFYVYEDQWNVKWRILEDIFDGLEPVLSTPIRTSGKSRR